MRLLLMSSVLFANFMALAMTASAATTFQILSSEVTGGRTPTTMQVGDILTVQLRIVDGQGVFGLGASAYGYDESVIDFETGSSVASINHANCFAGVGCFTGLTSVTTNPLVESSIGANGNRVVFFNGVGLTATNYNALDPGFDGVVGGGGAQVLLQFEAKGSGQTTLKLGTGYQGDGEVGVGGALDQTANTDILVIVGGQAATSYYDEVIADSPLAYWRMDDFSMPIADDIGGRLGYRMAGSVLTRNAGAFPGGWSTASGVDGATVLSPYDSTLNTTTFTIEAWAKFDSSCRTGSGSGLRCVVVRSSQPGVNDGFSIGVRDTLPNMTLTFRVNAAGQTPDQYSLDGPQINPGQWYHVVGTFDGVTQRLYVNGVNHASQPASFVPNSFAPFEFFGSDLQIAKDAGLDEVAYYNSALSSIRILQHYNAASGIACTSVGAIGRSTAALAAFQNNYCEDWSDVVQSSTDLSGSILALALLQGANLSLSDLSHANLAGADLSSSILGGSALIDADLSDAELVNSLLVGADLSGAATIGANFAGALYNEQTVFPSGFRYNEGPTGFPGNRTPWDAGMIPVPEPSIELLLSIGALGLGRLAAHRRS